MTSEEKQETLNYFHQLISDTVKYQILETDDDVAQTIYNSLKYISKYTHDQKNFIIERVCLDYMFNFLEKEKPNSLDEVVYQFKTDKRFATKLLDIYIDKYFQDELTINNFNRLCLEYNEQLDVFENNIPLIMYTLFTKSSYFNKDEKVLILDHLIKECKTDIEKLKEYDEFPCEEWFMEDLLKYEDNTNLKLDGIMNNKHFCLELIQYYFRTYILEDFQIQKIDNICISIMKNKKSMPSRFKIEQLYEKITEIDKIYNYKDAILNIIELSKSYDEGDINDLLEFVYDSDEYYEKFIDEADYGVEVLRKYIKQVILDQEENNIELIHEVSRKILFEIVDLNNSIDKNTETISYYLDNNNIAQGFYNTFYSGYKTSLKTMIVFQKICLISDYYNNYSDKQLDNNTKDNITLIKSNSMIELLDIFDNNKIFSKNCIENFVKSTFDKDEDNKGICQDIETLKKINPLLPFEQLSNKAYQKKIKK